MKQRVKRNLKELHPFVQLFLLLIMSVAFTLFISMLGMLVGVAFWGQESFTWGTHSDVEFIKSHLRYFQYIQLLSQIGMFLVPALFFTFFFQEKSFFKISSSISKRNILLSCLLWVAIMPCIELVTRLNQMIPFSQYILDMEEKASQLTMAFMSDTSWQGFLVNTLVVVIGAAISEEFVFRGVVLEVLRKWTKSIHGAVWISAIIFSFIHLQFLGFFPRVLLGLVLGYAFVYTGSIWASVLVHFLNNLLALIAFCVLGEQALQEQVLGLNALGIIAATVSLVAAIFICIKMRQWAPDYNEQNISIT